MDAFAEGTTRIEIQCLSSARPVQPSRGPSLYYDVPQTPVAARHVVWQFTESSNPYNRHGAAGLRRNSRFSLRRGMPILGALVHLLGGYNRGLCTSRRSRLAALERRCRLTAGNG